MFELSFGSCRVQCIIPWGKTYRQAASVIPLFIMLVYLKILKLEAQKVGTNTVLYYVK